MISRNLDLSPSRKFKRVDDTTPPPQSPRSPRKSGKGYQVLVDEARTPPRNDGRFSVKKDPVLISLEDEQSSLEDAWGEDRLLRSDSSSAGVALDDTPDGLDVDSRHTGQLEPQSRWPGFLQPLSPRKARDASDRRMQQQIAAARHTGKQQHKAFVDFVNGCGQTSFGPIIGYCRSKAKHLEKTGQSIESLDLSGRLGAHFFHLAAVLKQLGDSKLDAAQTIDLIDHCLNMLEQPAQLLTQETATRRDPSGKRKSAKGTDDFFGSSFEAVKVLYLPMAQGMKQSLLARQQALQGRAPDPELQQPSDQIDEATRKNIKQQVRAARLACKEQHQSLEWFVNQLDPDDSQSIWKQSLFKHCKSVSVALRNTERIEDLPHSQQLAFRLVVVNRELKELGRSHWDAARTLEKMEICLADVRKARRIVDRWSKAAQTPSRGNRPGEHRDSFFGVGIDELKGPFDAFEKRIKARLEAQMRAVENAFPDQGPKSPRRVQRQLDAIRRQTAETRKNSG